MKQIIEAARHMAEAAKDPEITNAAGVYHPIAQTKMLFKGKPLFKLLQSVSKTIGKVILKNAGHGTSDKIEGAWLETLIYSKKTGKFLITGYTKGSQVKENGGYVWKPENNSIFAYMLDLDNTTVKKIKHEMFKDNGKHVYDVASDLAQTICSTNSDFDKGDNYRYGMSMKKKVSILN